MRSDHPHSSSGLSDGLQANSGDQKRNIPKEPTNCPTSVISQTPIFPDPLKPEIFPIFINKLDGKPSTYDVSKTTRVEDLRRMIQERTQICPPLQRLLFSGHNMEDGHTLEHYNVKELCTIHLVIRLNGA